MKHSSEEKYRFPIFRERFRELQGDMSNTEFAEFLGISRQTVGFYCNGERIPDALGLKSIAEKCSVSADWLLGMSNTKSMETNLKAVCHCTGLSENAGVSPAHLSRQFKAETGMTISRFIARTRCEKAAFLLRTTDLAVQDISAHVGYLDNNYFVKVFRGIYGTTPSHYRTRF